MKRKVAILGVMAALALLVSFVETLIPMPIAIPGIKLGLANSVIVYTLYTIGKKDAFVISIVRIILSGFLFGNLAAILYSLSGALLSLFVMCIMKKNKNFSIVGISILGGVFHNVGQIMIAVAITSFQTVLFYIPFLLIAGGITGILIGLLDYEIIKRIPSNLMTYMHE